ncbi:hypothetical protein HBN50_17470 [Halobacteriovorax sp. GB3]|uniref:hypothetical protein n=1 Tax=Halobacteriovorax sp. GB3 TaxID=2719615 RepID=UPI002362DDA4|nr:hypothetical protein [Halobacteriovorax sp. GB3]MDD0854894.1 hypothetical protein [Halobacteriovorax sp. GB3]
MKNVVRKVIAVLFLIGVYGAYTLVIMKERKDDVGNGIVESSNSVERSNSNGLTPSGNRSAISEIKNLKHHEMSVIESVLDSCYEVNQDVNSGFEDLVTFKTFMAKQLGAYEESSFSWQNIHFESEQGDVFRLRVFMDDAENGEVKRLVLYKEDTDTFPVPVKIDPKDVYNPTPEVIQKYVNGGKVLYDELAESLKFDGGEVFIKKIGGKIKEAQITTPNGVTQCVFN